MRLARLVLTNLRRHRLRALIGMAGIAFGVAAMITILSVVHGAVGMFEHILSSDSDYLVFEKNVSDLFFSSVTQTQLDAIKTRPEVESAHAMLFGIVSSPGHPVITCFGLEDHDPRLDRGKWLEGSRSEFGRKEGEVVLGSRAADFLRAKKGDTVEIGRGKFNVIGICRTENGFEDGGVFMPLSDAQRFFHREDTASVVAVKLKNREQGNAFRQGLETREPGLVALENRDFNRSYNSFKILHFTSWAVGVCAFFLGGLGVANTMLLSVFSRIREIAVLRVCGFSSGQVAVLVLSEAAALALAGLVAGALIGILVLEGLEHAPWLQGYVQASLSPWMLAGVVVTAFITAIGGALYPAWYAAKIQPAEALRYE